MHRQTQRQSPVLSDLGCSPIERSQRHHRKAAGEKPKPGRPPDGRSPRRVPAHEVVGTVRQLVSGIPCGVESSPDVGLSFPTTLPIASRTSGVSACASHVGENQYFIMQLRHRLDRILKNRGRIRLLQCIMVATCLYLFRWAACGSQAATRVSCIPCRQFQGGVSRLARQGKAAPMALADHSLPLGQAVRQPWTAPPLSRLGQGVKRPNERVESGCPVDHLSNWLQSQHAW